MSIDSIEIDHMYLIFDRMHECIVLKYFIFGIIMPYLYFYLLDVGLKSLLVLD